MFQYLIGFAILYIVLDKYSDFHTKFKKAKGNLPGTNKTLHEYLRDDYSEAIQVFGRDNEYFEKHILNKYKNEELADYLRRDVLGQDFTTEFAGPEQMKLFFYKQTNSESSIVPPVGQILHH